MARKDTRRPVYVRARMHIKRAECWTFMLLRGGRRERERVSQSFEIPPREGEGAGRERGVGVSRLLLGNWINAGSGGISFDLMTREFVEGNGASFSLWRFGVNLF